MKIELITQEQYDFILEVQQKHPELTLQNKGYETIDNKFISATALLALKDVHDILEEKIVGYKVFQNFKISKDNEVLIRFQYNYNYDGGIPFIGVGYIKLKELLNGFKEN